MTNESESHYTISLMKQIKYRKSLKLYDEGIGLHLSKENYSIIMNNYKENSKGSQILMALDYMSFTVLGSKLNSDYINKICQFLTVF